MYDCARAAVYACLSCIVLEVNLNEFNFVHGLPYKTMCPLIIDMMHKMGYFRLRRKIVLDVCMYVCVRLSVQGFVCVKGADCKPTPHLMCTL